MLKQHEKFNNMLKCFKVLSHKFRHTAFKPMQVDENSDEIGIDEERTRCKVCFGAVAVLCQCQLENGQPRPPQCNVCVGDMQVNSFFCSF